MKRQYFCPACRATLNPNVKIILRAAFGASRGLALFSPQPGNYAALIDEELRATLQPGAAVEFACPVCGASLNSARDGNLAVIGFRSAAGKEGQVEFSRRWGEQATFLVAAERVQIFGADAARYGAVNFFGAGREDEE